MGLLAPSIIALTLLLLPATAAAGSGLYGSLSAGAAFVTDTDIDAEVGDIAINAEAEFDVGVGATGAAGYAFGNGLRTELELSWRRNELDEIRVGDLALDIDDGRVRALAAMANLAYDFDLLALPLHPYVMGGAGAAILDIDSKGIDIGDDDIDVDGSAAVFTYQAGAGFNFELTPNLTLFTGYRYFATLDFEIEDVDVEYRTHNAEVGLRYYFF
jgi:opacity protein-like surface antigen